MQERELRLSLRANGPLLPALEYAGELIDGAKRVRLCAELGIRIDTRTCRTLHEACAALWAAGHQRRALELAGARPLLELAELCGASTSAIAAERLAAKPKRKHIKRYKGEADGPGPTKARPTTPRGSKSVCLKLWMEPALKAYADECARLQRLSLSGLLRDALWERVAVVVPRAPLQPPGGKERRKAS